MRLTKLVLVGLLAAAAAACDSGCRRNGSPADAAPAAGAIPAPPDVAAAPADAARTASGLASKALSAGTGTSHPGPESLVQVHYTGWTTDGQMFDSSVARGEPTSFTLDGVIAGWTEGLQLMVEGETRRFWIPAELAYGDSPGRPQGMLVFDVELIDILDEAPADLAAPPVDAGRTPSGLAFTVLSPGTGTERPGHDDRVTIHYTGWTSDGKVFDTTHARGQPATIPIADAISGFRQGLQLMVEGEKRRLWIPESLAFKGAAGAPPGMLVFDVELVEIHK
ncbi:MAG TPA: FKBP-type peptidyl-prolyl cis-trans isomerase [Vicinamibacterales bacterium]|nr:FKBP-type peptidyl-prolyl cis-trans isomerase [Vicinamibacterales bacterium]